MRMLKRACKFCGCKETVKEFYSQQPNEDETGLERVRETMCTYCGARDA